MLKLSAKVRCAIMNFEEKPSPKCIRGASQSSEARAGREPQGPRPYSLPVSGGLLLGCKIADHVGAVLPLGQAREGHLDARNHAGRLFQVLVKPFLGPGGQKPMENLRSTILSSFPYAPPAILAKMGFAWPAAQCGNCPSDLALSCWKLANYLARRH